ncbi:MAG: Stp1/IreP family PP2C-type Ser/Thr phosphatase [Gammaproteobacteria bacterium]|nr:Stp1/IreP family PP2C-type Ser/Thr phosphatase [Gammaproteobacteria bacterium]NNF48559.1 Stp1/IreP family PP2C-type Ser/Thr phosphatase [Woeseiaceae bacterium]MBT8095201.1 Stp1/IreP family PP2C-type Ser/Thr phosphatase [Gammaproteobacteria bacterium]MBT8105359.1 Stp1/IreP family PP2C-type Ser/Thr phosphatase [Gammaproteobacteria bacterium]NNK25373.1 Stp1/IreP family PP2C-type Ser/Thr phosphatase [Woeseiaceae bacterium]
MSLRGKIDFAELTDTGQVREHNEDAIGTIPDIGLMVLADGMGGYSAGEVASGIAVQIVTDLASEAADREELHLIDAHSGLMRPSIILRDAIYRSNKIIYQTAQSQTHCEGMGTTIVACMFYDNKVSIAHVGDSRAYRMRGGKLEQMTLDHSLLQELVDRGFYSHEEAQRSTNRNYVTRALGVEPTVEVEVHEYEVQPDDIYLLCSDGLPDMVEDDDIHLTISTFNDSLDVVGQQLVDLANDHGGRDNISVMLAQVKEAFPAKRGLFAMLARLFRS